MSYLLTFKAFRLSVLRAAIAESSRGCQRLDPAFTERVITLGWEKGLTPWEVALDLVEASGGPVSTFNLWKSIL